MSQEANIIQEQHPQISVYEIHDKGLNNWQVLIQANSQQLLQQNQVAPVFSSQGKWSLEIKRRQFAGIDEPVTQLIKQDFALEDQDLEIQQKNDVTNIQQALELIGIKFEGISQEQWRQKYGFWEVSDLRVIVKDGNTTIVDFKNQSHHFVLFLETSLKNHTHANQNM